MFQHDTSTLPRLPPQKTTNHKYVKKKTQLRIGKKNTFHAAFWVDLDEPNVNTNNNKNDNNNLYFEAFDPVGYFWGSKTCQKKMRKDKETVWSRKTHLNFATPRVICGVKKIQTCLFVFFCVLFAFFLRPFKFLVLPGLNHTSNLSLCSTHSC